MRPAGGSVTACGPAALAVAGYGRLRSTWGEPLCARRRFGSPPIRELKNPLSRLVHRRWVGGYLEVPYSLVIGSGVVDVDPLAQPYGLSSVDSRWVTRCFNISCGAVNSQMISRAPGSTARSSSTSRSSANTVGMMSLMSGTAAT